MQIYKHFISQTSKKISIFILGVVTYFGTSAFFKEAEKPALNFSAASQELKFGAKLEAIERNHFGYGIHLYNSGNNNLVSRYVFEIIDDRGEVKSESSPETLRISSNKVELKTVSLENIVLEDGYYIARVKAAAVRLNDAGGNSENEKYFSVSDGEKKHISNDEFYEHSLMNVASRTPIFNNGDMK